MKRILSSLALSLLSSVAAAATLTASWTDPVAASASYTPAYSAEYRINGGAAMAVNGLATPALTQTITAVAGNTVELRYRASNVVVPSSPIHGPWTAWYTAAPAYTPQVMPAPTFILFVY